jgi:hypothetical protein
MRISITSSVMLLPETILMSNGEVQYHSKCYKAWYTGSIKFWDTQERNICTKCFNNAITI